MARLDFDDEAIMPGASRPVKISLGPSSQRRKVLYTVKSDEGETTKEYTIPENIEQIAAIIHVPASQSNGTISLGLEVEGEAPISQSLNVSLPDS